MHVYQMVYDMVNARPEPLADQLLTGIVSFLNDHCGRVLAKILRRDNIVSAYTEEWENYRTSSDYANRVCDFLNRYMKRTYDPSKTDNLSRLTIEGHAYVAWKRQILLVLKKSQSNRLVSQLLDQIKQARDGEHVELDILNVCTQSFVELNMYEENTFKLYNEEFQTHHVARTNMYYLNESTIAISSLPMVAFMKQALIRIGEEEERSAKMCHPNSLPLIAASTETHYILIHKEKIEIDFESTINHDRFEEAALGYQLLTRLPNGIAKLVDIFQARILLIAKMFVSRLGPDVLKNPREYVQGLVHIQKSFMNVCTSTFPNPSFVAAVDKAFRLIMNDTNLNPFASSPELLAKYCDAILKKNAKSTMSESEVEEQTTDVIHVFKYLDDKDVFQKFYARSLAKRLIQSTSVSEEAELSMLAHLKATCGFEYTFKLSRMFTDMTLSADLNNLFRSQTVKLPVDFYIHVLTAGSWPLTGPTTDFNLPDELTECVSVFTTFFTSRHSGRKLSWFHHLARAEVGLNYLDKVYSLTVSLYQLGVLLPFNECEKQSFESLLKLTRLNSLELSRILKGFLEMKLIEYELEGESLFESSFILNFNFTNKRTKIKALMNNAETKEEVDSTKKSVDEDRRLYLQAAIVRIMKTRKELRHTFLIQEVIQLAKSRFAPSVPMIKKCIEQLIEKQYIARLDESNDLYVYIS